MLIDITTKSGFACKVDDELFDDFEMLEFIQQTMSEDAGEKLTATIEIVKRIFGDYKKPLYEHIKKEHGRVLPEVLEADIVGVMASIGKAKN